MESVAAKSSKSLKVGSASPPQVVEVSDDATPARVGHLDQVTAQSQQPHRGQQQQPEDFRQQHQVDTVLEDGFDHRLCFNAGSPIQVEWDNKCHGFVDGFGLCSPTRWKPYQRGQFRSSDMNKLAPATFDILSDAVLESILDVRKEAFKLVTGKLDQSPFSEADLSKVRSKWAALLPDPDDALVVDH